MLMSYDEMIDYLIDELREERNKWLSNKENKFGYTYMLCNDMGITSLDKCKDILGEGQ